MARYVLDRPNPSLRTLPPDLAPIVQRFGGARPRARMEHSETHMLTLLLLAALPKPNEVPTQTQRVLRVGAGGVFLDGTQLSPDLQASPEELVAFGALLAEARAEALEQSAATQLPVSLGRLVLEVDAEQAQGALHPWLVVVRDAEVPQVHVAVEGGASMPLLLGGLSPVDSEQDPQMWVNLYLDRVACTLVIAPFPAPETPRGQLPCQALGGFVGSTGMHAVVPMTASPETPWQAVVDHQAQVLSLGRLPALSIGLRPDWRRPGESGRWMEQGVARGPIYYAIDAQGEVRMDGLPAQGAWVDALYECSTDTVRAFVPTDEAIGFQLAAQGQMLPAHVRECPGGEVGVWVVKPAEG